MLEGYLLYGCVSCNLSKGKLPTPDPLAHLVHLAAGHDPDLFKRLLGFPAGLPELESLRPPGGNTRPDGITRSYFARRQRGELPDTY
jgi:hypothetical protein